MASDRAPTDDTPTGRSAEPAGIGRNFVLSLVQQFTSALFTAGLTLYLVRALQPEGYGALTLALGIGALVQLLAEFGIPESLARFVAESRTDRPAVTALLARGLQLQLLFAGLCTGALAALAGPLARAYDSPGLVWPLRWMALAIFAKSVFSLYLNAFIALARVGLNVRVVFLESVTETIASVGLVAVGAGVAGATLGRAVGYLVGALAAMIVVARLFGRKGIRLRPSGGKHPKGILAYAVPLMVTNSAYTLYDQADVLIIGALLGTSSVGLFGAPLRMISPLNYFGQAVANSVAPRQARSSGPPRAVRAFGAGIRWLVIGHALLIAPMIVWATPIVTLLLGDDYSESANVLRFLAPYVFLFGISPLITTTVNFVGEARRRIPIVFAALGVNVVIDIILIPRIGVVAGAIGTTAAYCLYVPANALLLPPELRLTLRSLPITLVRVGVATALMSIVLYAVGTESLSLAAWLGGGAAGVVVFAAALLLTREISLDEVRRATIAAAHALRMRR